MTIEDEIGYENLTEISIFANVEDVVPKTMYLESWLANTIHPNDADLKEKVLKYRETFDPEIKKSLPCCTISATFEGKRSLDNIKKKNRFICLDIDRHSKSKKRKCNQCVDMLLVKELFMAHPCTLYCGLSVSGDGIYAIIKIEDENKLTDFFNMFDESLSRIGINIDASCKDYTRLRFFSYDPDAYFNPNALQYAAPKEKIPPKLKPTNSYSISDAEKVEKIIKVLEDTHMDITQSYEDWVKIGAALYEGFGDTGNDYFHRISSFYPDYDYKATERKWNNCKKMNKIKLDSLFYVASSYGVRY